MPSHGSSAIHGADDSETFDTSGFFVGPSSIDSHTSIEDSQELPSLCKDHEVSMVQIPLTWASY